MALQVREESQLTGVAEYLDILQARELAFFD